KFVKESVVYTLGDIFAKSLAFILIPIYTRYLIKSDYAIYNIVITIWPVLVILYFKGIAGYMIRGYFELKAESERKEFFGSLILLSLFISVVLSGLVHIFGDQIFSPLFKDVSYKPYLQFAVGIAFFKLFIHNVLTIYRTKRRPLTVVSLSVFNFAINVAIIILFVVILKKELMGALYGQVISLGLISLIFFLYIQKDIRYKIRGHYIRAALLFSIPLIPHALSGWIINLSDRILIERFSTLENLAIYALGYQLAMALDILINSMNQAWMPFFYSNAANKDQQKELMKSTTFYFTLVVAIGLLMSLYSREIILFAGKMEYIDASKIFPLIVLAFVIHSIYYMSSAAIFYMNKTYIVPFISITAGIINISLNIWWLPQFGYIAAAYSTIISFIVMAVMGYFFAQHFYPIPFQFSKLIAVFIIALLIYGISLLFHLENWFYAIPVKLALFALFPLALILSNLVQIKDIRNFKSIFFG
ncbi:oligosaccharide flippase family protein, partial [candidate division KSB1 bacterium]|nr:oligosaccharide flippase family protein [candidate division KSB1 bacterium]